MNAFSSRGMMCFAPPPLTANAAAGLASRQKFVRLIGHR